MNSHPQRVTIKRTRTSTLSPQLGLLTPAMVLENLISLYNNIAIINSPYNWSSPILIILQLLILLITGHPLY